ncbi:heterokaryon incompatibility protein-domain-containing protein [Neurospora tetraspora]|uniref:Heterokaryon incompatibility protein-domain-containing protein n=1 Tax=Neurospora tetraspora TaxID=94610 RepID=A0AAE0JER4_9PEZI|nr:heterokaryon incompatibility protein-domain-containing protein [Neurospora tetraspora]
MAPYQYPPLENATHFRILYIDPSEDYEKQLSGSLVHADLSDEPVFDALSYYWGAPDLSRRILIDGCELAITVNLDLALKRMRRRQEYCPHLRTGPIPIWADGICVNQKNIPERNHQVRLMSQIYSNCRECLIHLGEEADGSGDMGFIEKTVCDYNRWDPRRNLAQSLTESIAGITREPLSQEDEDGWTRFRHLLSRPWFRRLWVIQEFALPQQVRMICGAWEMAGGRFFTLILTTFTRNASSPLWTVVYFAAAERPIEPVALDFLASTRMRLGRSLAPLSKDMSPRPLPLFNLLSETRAFEATDPRDHFFAFLSLATDTKDSKLVADYSKTLEEVELEFARQLVDDGYGLAMLRLVNYERESPRTYLSWIPDWTGRFPQPDGRIWRDHSHKQPDPKTVCMATSTDERTLLVQGCHIEVVKTVGMPISDDLHSLGSMEWLNEIEVMTAGFTSYPSGIDPLAEAIWRAIIADRSYDQVRPAPEAYGSIYRKYCQSSGDKEGIFFFLAILAAGSVRFCITTGGFFGLVPSFAEAGDVIITIKGDEDQAMYAVRASVTGENEDDATYTWLGHAYVHDIWKVKKYEELEWSHLRIK